MVDPDSLGIEDAERRDLRQSGHLFVEEKMERLVGQFFQIAIRGRIGADLFGDARQHQVYGLDRAFRELR